MKRVDARGLSCPEPVIQTKNAMALKEECSQTRPDTCQVHSTVRLYVRLAAFFLEVVRCVS